MSKENYYIIVIKESLELFKLNGLNELNIIVLNVPHLL